MTFGSSFLYIRRYLRGIFTEYGKDMSEIWNFYTNKIQKLKQYKKIEKNITKWNMAADHIY